MNFTGLHDDAKRLILDHLDQADLYSVCLVNRDLFELAQPVLFSNIKLPDRPDGISSLIRSINQDKRLAGRIQRVSASLEAECLGPLLAAATNLKSLSWGLPGAGYTPRRVHYDPPVIPLDSVTLALQSVKDTLTDLQISNTFNGNRTAWAVPGAVLRTGSATDLKRLGQLRKLQIPFPFILKYDGPTYLATIDDCLPPSLEILTLTAETSEIDMGEDTFTDAIIKWLPSVRDSTPNLRNLCLAMSPAELWLDAAQIFVRRTVEELARQIGIEVEWAE